MEMSQAEGSCRRCSKDLHVGSDAVTKLRKPRTKSNVGSIAFCGKDAGFLKA